MSLKTKTWSGNFWTLYVCLFDIINSLLSLYR